MELIKISDGALNSIQREEDYYRSLSRISRHRIKERLTRELLAHLIDADKGLLAQEKKKADVLLENILPGYMIDELKTKGKVTPAHHEQVAVLFTDFVGFSDISRYMSPRELLRELSVYFDSFEEILEKYGIEKVKTVGDALMCVAGINKNKETAHVDCILAAFEMLRFTYERREQRLQKGEEAWGMRAAIHYGPLVAGVVGHSKIAFDIWGHTVNVAARIEGVAPAGKVTISEDLYDKVRDFFACDYMGEVELKGVGAMDLFTVNGFHPNMQENNDAFGANKRFQKLYSYLRQGYRIIVRDGKYHAVARRGDHSGGSALNPPQSNADSA